MARTVALFVPSVVLTLGCGRTSLDAVGAGPTEFVAVGPSIHVLGDGAPDRFRGASSFGEGAGRPAHVYVRLREGERVWRYGVPDLKRSVRAEARVEPNGRWSALEMQQGYGDPRAASIEIPRQYPDGAAVRIRIHAPSGKSEAVVRNLPATRRFVGLDGAPVVGRSVLPDVKVEVAAYRPTPRKPGDAAVVGLLLRADLPHRPGELWRLGELEIEKPYGPPDGPASSGKLLRYALRGSRPTLLQEQADPFADAYPRIGIVGTLERCETREETVDFGVVPSATRGARRYAVPHGPIRRTLSDGATITLAAVEPQNLRAGIERWTTLKIEVRGGAPWAGEDEAWNVSFPGRPEYGCDFRPNGGLTDATIDQPLPAGPLRIVVRRTRRADRYDLKFDPPVRPVAFLALASSPIGRLTYYGTADAPRLALLPKP